MLRRIRLPMILTTRPKTQRFKPKIAPIRPTLTPSLMALDHFDFYYAPLYGPKHWPSIRLGLLTPNKFVAVLNRLSSDVQVNEAILRDLGTSSIIEQLTAGKKMPKRDKNPINNVLENPQDDKEEEVCEAFCIYVFLQTQPIDPEQQASRSEHSMGEFRQPEGEFTYGQVQLGMTSLEGRRILGEQIQSVASFSDSSHLSLE